jgi:hypothetical protein
MAFGNANHLLCWLARVTGQKRRRHARPLKAGKTPRPVPKDGDGFLAGQDGRGFG